MDGIILAEYETVQSFQASWIEERVGHILLVCLLEIRDSLRKKAWPISVTFASRMCNSVIVQSMIKTGEHLPETETTPRHFQSRY